MTPFSFLKPDGACEGLDIDLARSLAAAMGAKLEVVKTSWSNLMPDFTAAKCGIAIGGISVTTERQKRAFFSAAYMVNGKTPIVRCDDVATHRSVSGRGERSQAPGISAAPFQLNQRNRPSKTLRLNAMCMWAVPGT